MWATMASPLILSQNVVNLSDYRFATYSNPEVIAVNQDPLVRQGERIAGGDLQPSSGDVVQLTLSPCGSPSDSTLVSAGITGAVPSQQTWHLNPKGLPSGYIQNQATQKCLNLDDCSQQVIGYECVDTGSTCAGSGNYTNLQFSYDSASGRIVSAYNGQCLVAEQAGGPTEFDIVTSSCDQAAGTAVYDTWTVGTDGSVRPRASTDLCLGVPPPQGSTNVWSKLMSDGSVVLTYLNVGPNSTDISCDSMCMQEATGWDASTNATIRDVIQRTDNGTVQLSQGLAARSVEADGGVVMVRLHKSF